MSKPKKEKKPEPVLSEVLADKFPHWAAWNEEVNIAGFDPGKKGALSVLTISTGKIVSVHRVPLVKVKKSTGMKTEVDYHALRDAWAPALKTCRCVVIEHIWGAAAAGKGRADGGASQFKLGYQAGAVFGIVLSLGLPYHFITPQAWHKLLNYQKAPEGENSKSPSFKLARKFFPDSVKEFARVTVDEGVAEASLIAYVGRLLILQGSG